MEPCRAKDDELNAWKGLNHVMSSEILAAMAVALKP